MAVNVAWMSQANCVGTDPESFFPAVMTERGNEQRLALRVCANCTVNAECLKYAVDLDLTEGIFGGLMPVERRRLKVAA